MKKLITVFIFLFSLKCFSQDTYFLGKTNYCTPQNTDSKKSFDAAISGLQFPKYYPAITSMLVKVIEKDPAYCDAYFLAGYYFRLQDMHKEALALYYVADSLAQNKAANFKQNLAIEYMRFGAADKARAKYEEMIKYFPQNPEGYYGVANSSIVIGDYENGISNLKKAENLYKETGKVNDDVKYMYGMLYAFKEDYEKSLPFFDEVFSSYKNDDNYLLLYSLSLIKVGKSKDDEKMIKKAKKTYERIKSKGRVDDLATMVKKELS